jgi:hypothetical protein
MRYSIFEEGINSILDLNIIYPDTVIHTVKFVRRKLINGVLHNLATDTNYDFGPVVDATQQIYSIPNMERIRCCDNGFHSTYLEGIDFYRQAYDFRMHGNPTVSAYLVRLYGEYDLFTYAGYGHKIASKTFRFIRQLSHQEINDIMTGKIDYKSDEFNIADFNTFIKLGCSKC